MPDDTCRNCRWGCRPYTEYFDAPMYCSKHRRFIDERCSCCDHARPVPMLSPVYRALSVLCRLWERCVLRIWGGTV